MRTQSEQEAYKRGLKGELPYSESGADLEAFNIGQAVRQGEYSEHSAAADGYQADTSATQYGTPQPPPPSSSGKLGTAMAKNVALPLIGTLGIAKDAGIAAAGLMFLEHVVMAFWGYFAGISVFLPGFKSTWASLFGAGPSSTVILIFFTVASIAVWLALFMLQRFLPIRVLMTVAVPLVWFFGLEHVLKLEFALKLPETWRWSLAAVSLVLRCGFLGSFVAKPRQIICSPALPKPTSASGCMAIGWIKLDLSGYDSYGTDYPATVNGVHQANIEITLHNEDYQTDFVATSDAQGCFWFLDMVPSLKYSISQMYVKVTMPDGAWADARVTPAAPIPLTLESGKIVSLGTMHFSRDNKTGALGLRLQDEPVATRTAMDSMARAGNGYTALANGNGLPPVQAILNPKIKKFTGNKAILPNVITTIIILGLGLSVLSLLGVIKV